MRDVELYALDCMEKLDQIGIEYGNVLEVTVNTRAKNRWGQCRQVPGGFKININSVLLDERNEESGLINTIFHELLHTCKGCMNHGTEWKRLAFKVYQAYGYEIKRTGSAAEKGVDLETRNITYKYTMKCTCCGQIIRKQRMCDFVKNTWRYQCGICKGKFERVS